MKSHHAGRAGQATRAWAACASVVCVLAVVWTGNAARADSLRAGVAVVDVTDRKAGPVHDPLYVKALVLSSGTAKAVLVTVDAVAIGEIGRIGNDYLPAVRARLQKELGLPPASVLVNASHCHGTVCRDVADRTVQAVRLAAAKMVPVRIGAGAGREDRIMVNRRIRLKDGREVDVRRAYSLPPDAEVAGVGPIDPQIGLLRLDREDGTPLAVVYHFACHPIQGTPDGGNTADLVGVASKAIEEGLGHGAVALFLQGCAGDVNPIGYKDVHRPRDAEPLGQKLGLRALKALRKISGRADNRLTVLSETVELPRADHRKRIAALEARRAELVDSLRGTELDLKAFMALAAKHGLAGQYPSDRAHRYLHERALKRTGLDQMDARNRKNMAAYVRNVRTMEQLTRLNTNLALLRKHQARNAAAKTKTLRVELGGVRIGDFVLTTFPGEPSVQIGLNIKKRSPHKLTFVAGYTNGYIYYTPTAEQLQNPGAAQEDCDCLLAPSWQKIYEAKALQLLGRL